MTIVATCPKTLTSDLVLDKENRGTCGCGWKMTYPLVSHVRADALGWMTCDHCGKNLQDHPEGKCLYHSSYFRPGVFGTGSILHALGRPDLHLQALYVLLLEEWAKAGCPDTVVEVK